MTHDQQISVTRGAVFTIGATLLAYGIDLSWPAIIGATIMASCVPGILSRAGRPRCALILNADDHNQGGGR